MTLFERTVAWLIDSVEGGLADDPRDPGGITHYGISLRFALEVGDLDHDGYPDLDVDGNGQVDAADIRTLPRAKAAEIYRTHFWLPLHCDELPILVAPAVFDCGVNQGRGPAVTMLQRAVGAVPDGQFGPITLRATRSVAPGPLLLDYLSHRAVRYTRTVNFDHFGWGWMRRLFQLYRFCLALGAEKGIRP